MTKPQTDIEELKELNELERKQSDEISRRTHVHVGETVTPSPEELSARKRRNLWIALAIGAFVLLVFAITVAQIQAGIVEGAA
jgi:hypothetical protein